VGFIRLIAALIGFVFGFFLGSSLLQVTQVTPLTNQILVVLLLATACAILGWLGAPYVTVMPATYIVNWLRAASGGDLIGGAFGAAVGLILALFLAFPLSFLPGDIGRYAPLVTAVVLGVIGATAGAVKRAELGAFAEGVRGVRRDRADARVLLDTSVIIDGRVADVVRSGFVRGTLIVPKFVLAELQFFNDSPDGSKRERGRRGLEMLAKMQKEDTVKVELSDEEPAGTGADVAELQGITVLNINDLAKAVRPVVLPGEEITVRVIQEGKEPAQAVGYLEDGTMVVVENGVRHIGSELPVTVMRVLQTVGGRMIFGHPKGETTETRRPRAIDR